MAIIMKKYGNSNYSYIIKILLSVSLGLREMYTYWLSFNFTLLNNYSQE